MHVQKPLKVVFMGRKPGASLGLRYLVDKGACVVAVVATETHNPADGDSPLSETASELGLPVYTPKSIEDDIANLGPVDLVVSYLYWKRIKPPLLNLGKIGCINLHPAPLPDYRGLGGYNFAILDGCTQYGVSAHFVAEKFDTGDIIQVNRFPIDPNNETAWSLAQESQEQLLILFKEVVDMLLRGEELSRIAQGEGRYINRMEMEAAKRINKDDTPETIERKVRAFWYPPYPGATIEIAGKDYTLVNPDLLKDL
jgi:methionyl-tRNA formyltransferase